MNIQDRKLLKEVYNLTHKEQNKVFNMVRSGKFTMDSAAKYVIKDREAK